jgi:hypothetical protein
MVITRRNCAWMSLATAEIRVRCPWADQLAETVLTSARVMAIWRNPVEMPTGGLSYRAGRIASIAATAAASSTVLPTDAIVPSGRMKNCVGSPNTLYSR